MNNSRKWTLLKSLTALGALLVSWGCSKGSGDGSSDGSAANTIKVGEFASLTGKEATFGQMSHHGTELAIQEVNAAGGVLGRKIELIHEDDQSKAG